MNQESNYIGIFISYLVLISGCIFCCIKLRNNDFNPNIFYTSNLSQNNNQLSEILINNDIDENFD